MIIFIANVCEISLKFLCDAMSNEDLIVNSVHNNQQQT